VSDLVEKIDGFEKEPETTQAAQDEKNGEHFF